MNDGESKTPDPIDAPARARERTGGERRPVVDEAIAEIISMVTAGTWRSGVSHAALAAKYAVQEGTVRSWATQAHRVLKLAIGDGDEIRTRLVVLLEDVHRRALDRRTVVQRRDEDPEIVEEPDLRAAVSAIAEQGKLLGLVETRHKVDISVQAMAQLSTRQQLAKARELLAALPDAIAALETKLAEEEAVTVPALPEGDLSNG